MHALKEHFPQDGSTKSIHKNNFAFLCSIHVSGQDICCGQFVVSEENILHVNRQVQCGEQGSILVLDALKVSTWHHSPFFPEALVKTPNVDLLVPPVVYD